MALVENLQLSTDGSSIDMAQERRVYRREWKKYRPHLQKSTSLPNLQLPPPNRPIFSCLQCGFANTLGIPLCPWCFWTSDGAKEAFERSEFKLRRRQRRVSAPPRVFWKQSDLALSATSSSKARPTAVSRPLMSEVQARRINPVIASSGVVPTRKSNATRVPDDEHLTTNTILRPEQYSAPTIEADSCSQREQASKGSRTAENKSNVLNYYDDTAMRAGTFPKKPPPSTVVQLNGSIDRPVVIVSPDTTPVSLSPSKGSNALPSLQQRLGLAPSQGASIQSIRPKTQDSMKSATTSSGVDRLVNISHVKTSSMQSLRSAHLVIDIKPLNGPYGTLHPNKPLNINLRDDRQSRPSSGKTLRRKGNVSVFRISNSTEMSSVFGSESETSDSRPPSATFSVAPLEEEGFGKHSRSKSQPINIPVPKVPLGHPSRPYYTAIRPDKMTPPTSASCNTGSWGRGRLSFQPLPPAPRPTSLPAQSNLPERCVSPGIFSVLSAPCPGSAESTATGFMRPETPVLDPAMLDSPPSPSHSHFHSLSKLFSSKRRPGTSMGLYEPTSSPDFAPPLTSSSKIKIQQAHAALAGSLSKSRQGTGFSLSGETEMKMALANARKEAVADQAPSGMKFGGRSRSRTVAGDEFRFKETVAHTRRGSFGNVARKMKEGFREYVLKKGLSPA